MSSRQSAANATRPVPNATRRPTQRAPRRTGEAVALSNWHRLNETACLSAGLVAQDQFRSPRSSLGGPLGFSLFRAEPAGCGAAQPFVVSAADSGRVRLSPAATLRCPMVGALDDWVRDFVAPYSVRYLGSPVTSLRVAASYSCRPINGQSGNKLSQHGRANAIDISAFTLADGRVITVKRGWSGTYDEARFLRAMHRGACGHFTTVLGPDADRFHHDHFHFDLATHGRQSEYRVCR
ncbi:MAG: extensin family protein [Hyphomicrobiaceae bacterium]